MSSRVRSSVVGPSLTHSLIQVHEKLKKQEPEGAPTGEWRERSSQSVCQVPFVVLNVSDHHNVLMCSVLCSRTETSFRNTEVSC